MSQLIKQAYDSETFRRQGHELIDQLADFLKDMQSGEPNEKVLNWLPPDEMLQKWEEDLKNSPNMDLKGMFSEVIRDSVHMHHPKYLGHQTSAAVPVATLAELLGGFLDAGMGVYEQGNAGVVMERIIIKYLAEKMGMEKEAADGFLTNGGTLGNLTTMLCARSVMIEMEVWEHGYEGRKYAFMVSEEAHYSVDRAIRVMGMGAMGLIKIPANDLYQMDTSQLELYFKKAKTDGIQVIGVIGNACATAVGGHDDLNAIADFCEEHKLWFHVDAAHGGSVLFSKKYRYLLEGIHRADSVILDFHKMAMMPTLVTAVIFKNGDHSYQTFSQKASYLWDNQETKEWYYLAKRTFELTKTSISYRIYATLRTYGEELFEQNIDQTYDLGKRFSEMLVEDGNFKLPVAIPESNIVCYRYLKEGLNEEDLDDLNLKIRDEIMKEGKYFIVQTRVRGRLFLRTTIVSPFTTERELEGIIKEVKMKGNSLTK